MRLLLATRFLRGVEGAIEDHYATLGIGFVAIGAVGSESRADFLDVVRGRRLAFEIPSSKLDAHIVAFAQNLQPVVCLLASIQDCVHFRHVRFVVDHATIHLDPGMRPKWQLLCPDYHLCEYPVAL